jgi:hypothetical protein
MHWNLRRSEGGKKMICVERRMLRGLSQRAGAAVCAVLL